MKRFVGLLAVLALAACGGGSDTKNTDAGAGGGGGGGIDPILAGRVFDRATGDGVPAATVWTTPATQTVSTNLDGAYQLEDALEQRYRVFASKPGCGQNYVDVQGVGTHDQVDVGLDCGEPGGGGGGGDPGQDVSALPGRWWSATAEGLATLTLDDDGDLFADFPATSPCAGERAGTWTATPVSWEAIVQDGSCLGRTGSCSYIVDGTLAITDCALDGLGFQGTWARF